MCRFARPAVLLISLAALAALPGCGERPSAPPPQAGAPPPAAPPPSPPPPPPQPSADEQLAKSLDDLGAQQSERGRIVRLSSARFKPGQTRFEPEDTARLDSIVSVLKTHPETSVLIEGHTDSRGSERANERLSTQRADAVRQALVERGIADTRLRTRGLGEAHPIADNSTEEGRQQNRRVELVFSNAEGRFASAADAPPSG